MGLRLAREKAIQNAMKPATTWPQVEPGPQGTALREPARPLVHIGTKNVVKPPSTPASRNARVSGASVMRSCARPVMAPEHQAAHDIDDEGSSGKQQRAETSQDR